MNKSLPLLFLLVSLSLASRSQTNNQAGKECRISAGVGFGGVTKNSSSVGKDIWLQLDYRLLPNVSVATEFDNLNFKQPAYNTNLPASLNKIMAVANSFSLLFKYHFPLESALKLAVASGWSYTITQDQYYDYLTDSTSQETVLNTSSYSEYTIPLLLEIEYPVTKKIDVAARGKYNLYSQGGATYAVSCGISFRL